MEAHPHRRRNSTATVPRRKHCIVDVRFPPPGKVLSLLSFILWTSSLVQLSLAGCGGHTSSSASALVCDAAAVVTEGSTRPPTSIVTNGQLTSYREDGFIVMRDVLDEILLEEMARSGHAIADRAARYPQFFSVVENGLIFDGGGLTLSTTQSAAAAAESTVPVLDGPSSSSSNDNADTHPHAVEALNVKNYDGTVETAATIFRKATIYSNIPQIAAELMELDPEKQNLRILR
jgi:hypothetical protein